MATTSLTKSTLEQLSSLSQLSIFRQIVLMLVLAASVALGTSVVLWSRDSNYTVLYSDLESSDTAEIVTALDTATLEYRIEPGTGYLSVPEEHLQETRLHLASLGLPRSATNGFDMLAENPALGTSNFIEQARYNRALEQELVKTIKLIRGVRDVRVHISIPKQTSFLRSSSKPGASVMLDLLGTQSINDTQIAGIAHLVASSVAGLTTDNVSIVDQKGNLLSSEDGDELNSTNEQMKYTRELEQEYTQRIIALLGPVVGDGNIRAQVTADVDFTVVETTAENYNPATSVIRSEQTAEESSGTATPPQPGALSLTPPALAAPTDVTREVTQETTQNRTNATRNYEIDKSVSYTKTVPGSVKRLSVAVLVDLNTPAPVAAEGETAPVEDPQLQAEKIARLTQLVKDTIGYNETRGDSVNIISERFSQIEESAEPEALPIWQATWIPSAVKQLAASVVVILLIFAVIKPALKSVVISPARQQNLALSGGGIAEAHDNGHGQGMQRLPAEPEHSKRSPTRSAYDENLALAQTLVQNEPARAARMIKEWVAND
ncbi:MAG: flagellar basal-body MS-ring/collar protein FliF [Pseudomonadota bacterium]